MKSQIVIPACLAVFLLTACREEAPLPPPASRPVKTIVVGDAVTGDMRQFPGVVDAIQKADLSFRVDGKLKEILVKEGELVEQGQTLAKLDPTDYQITLNDRKASFNTAKANFDRAKDLVEKGAISQSDRDKISAQYFTAKANLEAAEQNLMYTTLTATFAGYIAKRHVENFEEVRQKQTVFTLQDVSALEIKIDVPETLMIQLRRISEPNKPAEQKRMLYAVFDQIKDHQFPLVLKEVATTADPNTRTFQVTLKMDSPQGYNVLPGMTATVHAEVLPNEQRADMSFELPISAVVSSPEKQSTVWLVDESTMSVSPHTVSLGSISNNSIMVSGLDAGSRVVTAGAAFLREGMKVTLLQTGEQPAQ